MSDIRERHYADLEGPTVRHRRTPVHASAGAAADAGPVTPSAKPTGRTGPRLREHGRRRAIQGLGRDRHRRRGRQGQGRGCAGRVPKSPLSGSIRQHERPSGSGDVLACDGRAEGSCRQGRGCAGRVRLLPRPVLRVAGQVRPPVAQDHPRRGLPDVFCAGHRHRGESSGSTPSRTRPRLRWSLSSPTMM